MSENDVQIGKQNFFKLVQKEVKVVQGTKKQMQRENTPTTRLDEPTSCRMDD